MGPQNCGALDHVLVGLLDNSALHARMTVDSLSKRFEI